MPRSSWIITCFAVTLAGCKVGPDYQAPTARMPERYGELPATSQPTTPATTTAPAAATDLAQWWRSLSDPELDRLVEQAISANLDLKIATARVREARAQSDLVAGNLYPGVESNASFSRQYPSENGQEGYWLNKATGLLPIEQPGLAHELYRAGFDASWELDLFGGVRRGVEAAEANAAAVAEQQRDLLISLVAEVSRNYIELRAAQRRLAIAQSHLAAQRSTLELVRAKRQAGTVTELDVSQAAAQVALSESQIPVFTRQIRLSIHALNVLVNEDLESLDARLRTTAPIPLTPADVPDVGIPADLVRRRPDIRQAEQTLAAATAQIGVATADLYPRFSLSGRFGMESTRFARWGNWDSHGLGFGPSVRWPVFDGGRIRANIRVQTARQEQALAGYERTLINAVREVEDALATYASVQARRRSLADGVELSRQAVELAQFAYDEGATDLLTVLDAQRTLYTAQDALAGTDQAVVLSLVALYKALGGGWDLDSVAKQ